MYENFTDQVNCTIARKITDHLVMDKILEGMSNCDFYKDMDPRFLENIKEMTGTVNGFEMSAYSVRFIITPAVPTDDYPVVSFIIGFSRKSYNATGVSDIIYRPGVSENTMDEDKAIRQIKAAIDHFLAVARDNGIVKPIIGEISFDKYPSYLTYPEYTTL